MKTIMTLGLLLTAKDMMSPVLGKTEKKLGKLQTRASNLGKAMTAYATAGVAGSMAIGSAIGKTVGAYQKLAAAQGEVRSLGIDDAGIRTISNAATKFSNEFAGTTAPQFVRASYDIKSGISSLSSVGVAEFTALAALTGKATKSTTEQMTSFFATGYGIYAKQFDALQSKTVQGWRLLSQEEKDIKFGEAFAGGIAGAVKEFKTTGGQMQAAVEALGATATTSNVPLAEQLAILGTLQKSMSGSEAATKYKAFINASVGASKKLELSFMDSNNQLLSTPEILDVLKEKYGKTLDDMEKSELKKAFGTDEAMAYITALYDKTDNLTMSQERLSKAMKSGTKDVLTMAQAMNEGREFELLGQNVENLLTVIGKQFAPMALNIAKVVGEIATGLSVWVESNEPLASGIATVVASSATFLGVVGSLIIGVKSASFVFGLLSGKSKTASTAVDAVSTALNAVSGKPINARMGVSLPKKASMLGKLSGLMGDMSRYVAANPLKILGTFAIATAIVTSIGAMAQEQKQQIDDKRIVGDDEEKLKQKLTRLEDRLMAMKGQGSMVGRAKEFTLNGTANKYEIEAQEKLVARAKKALGEYKPASSASRADAVERKPRFSQERIAEIRREAFRIRDARLKELGLGTHVKKPLVAKIEQKKAENKTINNHKEVTVNAPIHITVNAVEGKPPTEQIANGVKSAVETAAHKANQNTQFEDQE